MIRYLLVFSTVAACSSHGAQGPAGPKGDTGSIGPIGVTGAPGLAGVCDASSCSQLSSVQGLSGGVISGTTTLDDAVITNTMTLNLGTTSSNPTPSGIVIERGNRQTSSEGFYCGVTSFSVNGLFVNSGHTYSGLQGFFRVAKMHCQSVSTCGAAAHVCTAGEVLHWMDLGGGTKSGDDPSAHNPDVPMPDNGEYWMMSPDIAASCASWGGGATTSLTGLTYDLAADEGITKQETCDKTFPLLCCQ